MHLGGGLAPPPTSPLQAALPPSRAEEQRGGWGWGGGFRAGQAREPGPAPAAAPTPAPFLPARLSLPARACPPSARGCRRPGLAQSAPSPSLPSPRPSGPPASRPLPCPPAPSLAPTAPPCSHTGRSVPHAGLWLWAVALSPGWGAGPPLVPCSSHLEVPVHVEPWAGAWQGHKDSRAKGGGPLPCPPQSTRALGHGQNQELFLPLTSAVLQRPAVPTVASEKAQRAGHPVPGMRRAVRPHCTVGILQGRRGLPGR